jgi:hypothetical protein
VSARPRLRRPSRFEAVQRQAHLVAVERERRGRPSLHFVLHRPLREWGFHAEGRWPENGRALYAWRIHFGPLEVRRFAS